jgi:hypothetical protein
MKWMVSVVMVIVSLSIFGAARDTPQVSRNADITLPPVVTFKKYCARCHGYEGSAYGKNFGLLIDDSLKAVIEDMMFGPAGLNPDSLSVAAMVAYNRAISKKIPFASVLNARSYFQKRDTCLIIEASPGTFVADADSVWGNNIDGYLWRVPPVTTKSKIIQIVVLRKGDSTCIHFPDELWNR